MSYALCPHPIFLILLCPLALSIPKEIYTGSKTVEILITLALALAAYGYASYRLPALPSEDTLKGTATFHIEKAEKSSSFFNRSLVYKGTLTQFETQEHHLFHNLPCEIFLPINGPHPSASHDYTIEGTLLKKEPYKYHFKPTKETPWHPISDTFSLAEWRLQAKAKLHRYLSRHLTHSSSQTLLFALLAGESDEKILSLEFNKVGLQHLLAISGFHFTLIGFSLALFLRVLFPYKIYLSLLIVALTVYYLFVGSSPAIQRAYLAAALIAVGKLANLRISGLNALGVALTLELLLSPLNIQNLGFQFSFLCTLAILLLYPLTNSWLDRLLPKRSFYAIKTMPLLDKHGYLVCQLLRKGLALNLAIHLFSIPVILFIFHKFSLLTLVYNLFIPPLLALSIMLTLFAFLIPPLFTLADHWTALILHAISHPPAALDFCIRTNQITPALLYTFLATLLLGTIFVSHKKTATIS